MDKRKGKTSPDARKHPRYHPPEGTIAALRPYGDKIGIVRDIGPGGLSFDYLVPDLEKETDPSHEPHREIDVYWPDKRVHINHIQCEVVWENAELTSNKYTIGTFGLNSVGVQFRDDRLTTQKILDDFLTECSLHSFPCASRGPSLS